MNSMRWFAGAVAVLALGAAGCQGDPGQDGAQGLQGLQGDTGEPGAKGDPGEPGAQGDPGEPGAKGDPGEPGAKGDPGEPGAKGDPGEPGEGYLALEPAGVVGRVLDGGKKPVTSGAVYFVPAADVAALPATTVAVDSTNDEPLEDLIAKNGATYLKATLDAEGAYGLATLPAGKWFVTYVPAATDKAHLPGGDLCRSALTTAELKGARFDLRVSDAIPAGAKYVGSGACVTCHGKKHIGQTMHRLGIWSPYEHGPLQDASLRKDELYQALSSKFSTTGTKVWFYAYDSTRKFDKYKTAESDPGSGVSLTVTVRKKGNDFEFVLDNVKNPADPNTPLVLKVDAIYGGGIHKQRYLTKVKNASGSFWAVLPLQFNSEGKEDPIYPRTSKVWRDYHADWWFNETTGLIVPVPAAKNAFEKNCMSCHASTATITGSDTTAWTAKVVSDPIWGDFDYDGDGVRDEMNLSCETCHGPGSAHWEAAGQGKFIVAPSRLTPEREAMLCGQCHSRPKGALGTDSPVNAKGEMMIAGTSRADFLAKYATKQLDGAADDFFADDAKHSKSHHQQYSDFIRSKLYKNGDLLMTCAECHDPHKLENTRQLRNDPTDNVASCGGCHAETAADVVKHMDAKLVPGAGAMMANAKCTDCHMPKAAKSGAGSPGIKLGTVQFWEGDISSHMFDMPKKATAKADGSGVPNGYTKACGTCHTKVL